MEAYSHHARYDSPLTDFLSPFLPHSICCSSPFPLPFFPTCSHLLHLVTFSVDAAMPSSVLSPITYELVLNEVYGKNKLPFRCIDILYVPDYRKFFKGCIDKKFSRYTKNENSVLSWKFEAVDRCRDFPFGCATWYRAYANDEVFEIVGDPAESLIGYKGVRTLSSWGPCKGVLGSTSNGMYIITKLPEGPFVPAQFETKVCLSVPFSHHSPSSIQHSYFFQSSFERYLPPPS